ncbi:MAG: histidinol-phosphate transaminase [Flavobacteriaceae bacterium]|jgi:histidinol-phosphate aminotransferase|nr:histidinol-phosphate transaminase [Flavobacteriaceae bacterium]
MSKINLDILVRKNILEMNSYSSARDEFENKKQKLVFLDANESPFQNEINRYPNNKHIDLKQTLLKLNQLSIGQIVLGNGTDEILDLIMRVFCDPGSDKIITIPPTYGMYDVIAKTNNVENIKVPLKSNFTLNLEELKKSFTEKTKLLFLCSPNNPTGNSFSRKDLIDLIESFNGVVVIDEAYINFSSNSSLVSLINKYNNLIVTQTMSKAFGMAGIRLGMGFSNNKIVNYINKIKPPYNINLLTEKRALKELKNIDTIKTNIKIILEERNKLIDSLNELSFIIKVYPSDSNFILIKVDDADLRYKQLIEKGIVLRNRSKELLCDNCLRITIGTPYENELLIKNFKEL